MRTSTLAAAVLAVGALAACGSSTPGASARDRLAGSWERLADRDGGVHLRRPPHGGGRADADRALHRSRRRHHERARRATTGSSTRPWAPSAT